MKRFTVLTVTIAALLLGCSMSALADPGRHGEMDNAFQIRLGQFMPEGGGTLWDDNEEFFTLDVSDFNDFVFGISLIRGVNNHFEVGINADFYDDTVPNAYRDYVDEAGFLIIHDTRLEAVPLTVDVRFLPTGRYRMRPGGRSVLQPTFYVGAGAGVNFWEYEEIGDFVDFGVDPAEVFFDRFKDDGVAFEVHVLAGVELPLSPTFNAMIEGRHSWSDDTLGGSLAGLGDIELGGTSIFVGGAFRF